MNRYDIALGKAPPKRVIKSPGSVIVKLRELGRNSYHRKFHGHVTSAYFFDTGGGSVSNQTELTFFVESKYIKYKIFEDLKNGSLGAPIEFVSIKSNETFHMMVQEIKIEDAIDSKKVKLSGPIKKV